MSQDVSRNPQLVAMVHVPSNNALQNTIYNDHFHIPTYSVKDTQNLIRVRQGLYELHARVKKEYAINFLEDCRSSIFILKQTELQPLIEEMLSMPFVKYLVDRALREVEIFTRNGIKVIEVENIGAPYFYANEVPFEDMFILYIVAKAIRERYPDIKIGMHILSCDEVEALALGIAINGEFIRSETSVFFGIRPEGMTINRGNLAKLYYLRNFMQAFLGKENPKDRRYPQVWSDLQKKHTVFLNELQDLKVWLNNIEFIKVEGIILTGAETGKDVSENDLILGRSAIDKLAAKTKEYFGEGIKIPLITGSGLDVGLYKKYADYIITGTQLKQNKYWENEVSEENVKELVKKFS